MRRSLAAFLLLGVGLSMAGCYYGPPGPRWCYYHPHRCPPPPPPPPGPPPP